MRSLQKPWLVSTPRHKAIVQRPRICSICYIFEMMAGPALSITHGRTQKSAGALRQFHIQPALTASHVSERTSNSDLLKVGLSGCLTPPTTIVPNSRPAFCSTATSRLLRNRSFSISFVSKLLHTAPLFCNMLCDLTKPILKSQHTTGNFDPLVAFVYNYMPWGRGRRCATTLLVITDENCMP